MSFYLYIQLEPTTRTLLTFNQTIITNSTITNTTNITKILTYNTTWYKPTEDQAKFSQQLLTTIGTLVTAVSAFYFGTQSVEVAKEVTPSLKLNPSGETTKSTKDTEPLTITAETTPKDEKIIWDVSGDKKDNLIQKLEKFEYTPSKDLKNKDVTLTFTLAKYNVSEKLTVHIKDGGKEDVEKKKVEEEAAAAATKKEGKK